MRASFLALLLFLCVTPVYGECLLVTALHNDGPEKMEFEAELQRGAEASLQDAFLFDGGSREMADPVSLQCLSCHDGVVAARGEVTIGTRAGGGNPLGKSHPIGMRYADVTAGRDDYVRMERLDRAITLVGGQVGCLSCHDMRGGRRNHLAVSNDGSRLCFACHIK